MVEVPPGYVYHRGQHGIFAEIYFPRRSAAQGTIFTALQEGYKENTVKRYLEKNASELLEELKAYQQIFDPRQYDKKGKKRRAAISTSEAEERIAMYRSPFKGWSNYAVDGVWFNENRDSRDYGKPVEESTQILRLMFRLESSLAERARSLQCQDVLRLIIFRAITTQVLISERSIWDEAEQARFIRNHGPWPTRKLSFVKKHFAPATKEVAKWMDDCWLFMFGYLVRQFSEKVLEIGRPEEEIWVTSFFNLTVNVMRYAEI